MRSVIPRTGRKLKQAAACILALHALAFPAEASNRNAMSALGQNIVFGPMGSLIQASASFAGYLIGNPSSEIYAPSLPGSSVSFLTVDGITTGSVPRSFFGTVAVPFSSIAVRSQWERVRQQSLPSASDCNGKPCEGRVAKLRNAVARGKTLGFAAKLSLANATVNAVIRYQPDREAYGKLDHWASPREMVVKGAGDCEDFAILKQTLLRAMGVPDKSLSIVILKDNARNLYHAVLGVSTNQGHLILDNVRSGVFRDTQVANYQPLFSFSGSRSWVHGVPSGEATIAAGNAPSLNSIAPGESAIAPVWISSADLELAAELRPSLRD